MNLPVSIQPPSVQVLKLEVVPSRDAASNNVSKESPFDCSPIVMCEPKQVV